MTAKKLGLRSHIGAEVSVDALGSQMQPPSWQPHSIHALVFRDGVAWELVPHVLHLEGEPVGQLAGRGNRLRHILEKSAHLSRGTQMPLAVLLQQQTGFVERAAVPNAGQHIEDFSLELGCHADTVRGKQREMKLTRKYDSCLIASLLFADTMPLQLHIDVLRPEGLDQSRQCLAAFVHAAARERCGERTFLAARYTDQTLCILFDLAVGSDAVAFAALCELVAGDGRSAAREVGKSLGFDADMQTRLTRLVGSFEWKGPTDTMAHHFQQAGFDLQHPRIAKYLELSIRMLDLPRHLGQHSGGMIIAQGQLASVVPIEPASMPGRYVVQWDKEDCADMGLIKVDLLGLGMMAVLKDCVELIPRYYGEQLDIAQIPHDDSEVYASLQKADTIGLFQVESRAQMASLPRNHPDKFYDLVVQVAIIRPGPIVGQMMNPYMERRRGRQEIEYPHPLLEPVLRRTLGVPLFQEQLLRIAMVIANFTGGEAEELRRALGSRRSADKMKALESKLRAGMDTNGVSLKAQEEIILAISSFALYGFPESHAASFALIAYASAWLKLHYLPAFTTAILNNQPMGFYSAAVLVKDAQRHGLRIRPVDILRSDWNCILEREPDASLSLRLGLRYVRGLRSTVAAEIERAKALRPFSSIEELARRVPSLSQSDLSTLAETGALNSLGKGVHRRDALWQIERAGRPAGPLLSELDGDEEQTSPLHPMSPEERMVADYAQTGVTVGRHPMAHCRDRLRSMDVCRAGDLKRMQHGLKARIAGQVIARQWPGTAHGFIFLSIEDETGIANAIIDPDLYEAHRSLVTYAKFLLIEGALQNIDKVVHIRAKHIEELNVTTAPMVSHDFH